MEDLKPCPFCGNEPHIRNGNFGSKWIVCLTLNCAIHGKETTISLWQDRAEQRSK